MQNDERIVLGIPSFALSEEENEPRGQQYQGKNQSANGSEEFNETRFFHLGFESTDLTSFMTVILPVHLYGII